MKVAAAIFARTPGRSAPKTRLAKQVGSDVAEKLYELSLACCAELAHSMRDAGVDVCWAVAEKEAIGEKYWRSTGLPAISSGEGALGTRLAHVHGLLLDQADVGIMLGSDSPQLRATDIELAWQIERSKLPLVGPAMDGGFYLYADAQKVATEKWEQIEYSTDTTLAQLQEAMAIKPVRLAKQPDFDDIESLAQVISAMPDELSEAQKEFKEMALDVLEPNSLELACSAGA